VEGEDDSSSPMHLGEDKSIHNNSFESNTYLSVTEGVSGSMMIHAFVLAYQTDSKDRFFFVWRDLGEKDTVERRSVKTVLREKSTEERKGFKSLVADEAFLSL